MRVQSLWQYARSYLPSYFGRFSSPCCARSRRASPSVRSAPAGTIPRPARRPWAASCSSPPAALCTVGRRLAEHAWRVRLTHLYVLAFALRLRPHRLSRRFREGQIQAQPRPHCHPEACCSQLAAAGAYLRAAALERRPDAATSTSRSGTSSVRTSRLAGLSGALPCSSSSAASTPSTSTDGIDGLAVRRDASRSWSSSLLTASIWGKTSAGPAARDARRRPGGLPRSTTSIPPRSSWATRARCSSAAWSAGLRFALDMPLILILVGHHLHHRDAFRHPPGDVFQADPRQAHLQDDPDPPSL